VVGDLKSRRAVIAFGVGLWSAFTALGAAVRGFGQLLVCRAMVGVGEAGYGPAAQALIAEFFRGRRRAFAIGVYSVGMAFGGVLGIWLGGVLAERYGWRTAFIAMGAPGLVLALLASRLREPQRQAPASVWATLARWYDSGVRNLVRPALPLAGLTLAGAAVSGVMALFQRLPSGVDTAVFGGFVTVGVVWTVMRLVPIAIRRTTEATVVAATAFEDFLQAAATVLRTPTLIWMFVGGALVTFAVNGLIAWAPSFMERVHGFSVGRVGREFGIWGLAGGALGGLFGGRVGDWLLGRWPGGRPRNPGGVADSGAGHGAGESMKIAVLFDTLHPDWSDADYKKAIETKVEEAEYDVGRALVAKGHDVLMVGVHEALPPLLDRLAGFQPKLVFNGCEAFRGRAHHEYG